MHKGKPDAWETRLRRLLPSKSPPFLVRLKELPLQGTHLGAVLPFLKNWLLETQEQALASNLGRGQPNRTLPAERRFAAVVDVGGVSEVALRFDARERQ